MNILRPVSFFAVLLTVLLSSFFSPTRYFISPYAPNTAPTKAISPDSSQWIELIQLDSSIRLDIRYATANNFVKTPMYPCAKCYLKPAVAKAIVRAHQYLQKKGLGLKMFDCYRPLSVQWNLWKKVPDARYVADPRKGSMHNRGSAVDLTIVDNQGRELDMGTPYDYFGVEAYTDNQNLAQKVLANRKLLQDALIAQGFRMIRTEWWHFSYTGASYPISDMTWKCP